MQFTIKLTGVTPAELADAVEVLAGNGSVTVGSPATNRFEIETNPSSDIRFGARELDELARRIASKTA